MQKMGFNQRVSKFCENQRARAHIICATAASVLDVFAKPTLMSRRALCVKEKYKRNVVVILGGNIPVSKRNNSAETRRKCAGGSCTCCTAVITLLLLLLLLLHLQTTLGLQTSKMVKTRHNAPRRRNHTKRCTQHSTNPTLPPLAV
jgi:hypothetical protein